MADSDGRCPPGFWIDHKQTGCVACGSYQNYFGKSGEYHYVKCSNCGTLQLHPMPTKTMLAELYKKEYVQSGHHIDDCWISEPRNRAVLRTIINTEHPHGKIVDLGCGKGCLCSMLQENGLDYIGLEPSYCNTGLNIVQGDIDSIQIQVSVIVMIAVFEHMVDHDEFLEKCYRILKPGGLLIILSPTAHFASRLRKESQELPKSHNLFCPPWHTVLFSIKGIRYLMNRHGFEVESARVSSPGNRTSIKDRIIRSFFIVLNSIGFALREDFPFVVSHIFVCRKVLVK